MTSSQILRNSKMNEVVFHDRAEVITAPKGKCNPLQDKAIAFSDDLLTYADFVNLEADTSLGPERVYILDEKDSQDIKSSGIENMYPNLTEYMKRFPHKMIYLRAFSSTAVNREGNRRVFAEEVLEIIPLLLAKQGCDAQPERMKIYETKWQSEKRYYTIGLKELASTLGDFNIDKKLLTIVYDIYYFSAVSIEFPMRLGNSSIHIFSPDKEKVISLSQAIFAIYRLATTFDWDSAHDLNETNTVRNMILAHMNKYIKQYDDRSYMLKNDLIRETKALQKECFGYNMVFSPFCNFSRVDFNDVMTVEGFLDLASRYNLANYDHLSLPKEECKKGVIPIWKVNLLLLLDWMTIFFKTESRSLETLILQAMDHLLPVWKLESDDELMSILINVDKKYEKEIKEFSRRSAVLIDNVGLHGYSVKHEPNHFQIKRCRKWVHRDIINSQIPKGEAFDVPAIQKMVDSACQDIRNSMEKTKVQDEENAALGESLLKKIVGYQPDDEIVRFLVPKNSEDIVDRVQEMFNGKSKNKACTNERCDHDKKEMRSRNQELQKAVKQAESKTLKLKDKVEKEWKKKMEAKEKKWAEERKTLKEKLSAKERKSQEEKTALEMKIQELQQALEEKERQMEEKEKEMTEKVIDLQRKNENFERQVQHLRKAIPPPPKSQYSADVRARLIQLQSTRDQMIAENPSEKAAKKVRELLKVNENIKRGANNEMKKFNMDFREYMTAIDETIRLIQSNPKIDIADIPEMPPFPKLCDGLEKTYEKDVLQKKAVNFEFDISDDSGASTSSSSASSSSSSSPPSSITSSDEHDDECPICLCTIEEKEHDHKCDVCRARYHAICSSDWLFKNSTCPNCRSRMVEPTEFQDFK